MSSNPTGSYSRGSIFEDTAQEGRVELQLSDTEVTEALDVFWSKRARESEMRPPSQRQSVGAPDASRSDAAPLANRMPSADVETRSLVSDTFSEPALPYVTAPQASWSAPQRPDHPTMIIATDVPRGRAGFLPKLILTVLGVLAFLGLIALIVYSLFR